MSRTIHILWTDDEIDLLKPYILFLEEKGYRVSTTSNGEEAIDLVQEESFDLIFLDENMPGISGLQTLERIKSIAPSVPVVMITKSEEEDIMDEAIGGKIADYLIKPVNPKQILLTIKKHIDTMRLVTEKTRSAYQIEFSKIGMEINSAREFEEWVDIYKKLVYWETELEQSEESGMSDVLDMQWAEANNGFFRYMKSNYIDWFSGGEEDRPVISPQVFPNYVFPLLKRGGSKVVVLVIDNLRFDQWKLIEREINGMFTVEKEDLFCSILPTATQYARNAMFAGLMPAEIKKLAPEYWVDEDEEEGKNQFEKELLKLQMQRNGITASMNYEKVTNMRYGKKLVDSFHDLMNYDLNVLVYNFVDMLSHARTEMDMIKELAFDNKAYRDLTKTWFTNSYLLDLIKLLSEQGVSLVLTTDHGATRVQDPIKVVGDKNTSTNLRYKQGRNLSYQKKEVFEVLKPEQIHLPKSNVSTSYIFSGMRDFMVYPNNYNHYVHHFRNSLQHGGISMEEMLIPCVILKPRS